MDNFDLRWLCVAVLFVPLTANANKVSTERVVGTTSYGVKDTTISKPSNATFSPVRDVNPTPSVQRLPSGGLSQSASGNLYIAQKDGSRLSTPVKGAFNFAKDNLKSGAKNMLKLNPWQLAGGIGLAGLDKLLRDHGWEPHEDGITKPPSDDPSSTYDSNIKYDLIQSATAPCPSFQQNINPLLGFYFYSLGSANYVACGYRYKDESKVTEKPRQPASPQDVDDLVDDNYEPAPEDWDYLFPHIHPDSFSIDSIPSVSTPSTTSTSTSTSSGITTTIESFTNFDFDFDNSTETPSITVTETETDIKYENGEKVDETTTTTTNPPAAPLPDSGGSGSGFEPPSIELPSFCSWASTVCNWIGWTQEMPDGDEPDLSRLMNDYEFEQTNTVSFGSKQCPEPITLNLTLINKPVKITFDAFCALAGYLYFLVMASAYIIAARITLGVARG